MSNNQAHLSRRSRKRWTGWASVLVIACCLSWAFVWSAAAQDTCYRVVDLGALGFTPLIDDFLGINNANQAVFTAVIGGQKHAMLYLPADDYDLTAGVHDLHALAGFDAAEGSGVHDINDAGLAVGWATFDDEQHAVVWRIDLHDQDNAPPIPFSDLGLLDLMDSTYSVAFAINNESPFPIIVGESDVLYGCGCTGSYWPVSRGYWVEFTEPPPLLANDAIPLVHDNTMGCKEFTSTRDVNTPADEFAPTIAAGLSVDGVPPCFADPIEAATVWENGVAVGVDLQSPGPSRLVARGVSDSGAVVGNTISFTSALYWPTTMAAPLDIGNGLTGISRAQRINNNDPPSAALPLQVAGWRDSVGAVAVLWECEGDCDELVNWSATDLNDTIQQCSNNWFIRRAYDVADSGWIISVGTIAGQEHAVLLAPLANCSQAVCLGDIDGNNIVGASDLLALLAAWGPCPAPPAACDADLDCDGSVGASDLLILLANWGPCEEPIATGPPQDVLDCINRFCCDEEDLLALEKCLCSVDPECDPSP